MEGYSVSSPKLSCPGLTPAPLSAYTRPTHTPDDTSPASDCRAGTDTPDSSDPRTGTTDTKAEVTDDDKNPKLEDYILDPNAEHVYEGVISGDGKLVLKVYFKQKFTVIYEPCDHGTFATETNPNLNYGVDTPEAPEPTGESGYVFAGWSPVIEDTVTKNMTYVAQWRRIVVYTIPTTGID